MSVGCCRQNQKGMSPTPSLGKGAVDQNPSLAEVVCLELNTHQALAPGLGRIVTC